jgi:L-alanine-DL-glutamate epimerase-like enolase superfamily enzyme
VTAGRESTRQGQRVIATGFSDSAFQYLAFEHEVLCSYQLMKVDVQTCQLRLKHEWTIASGTQVGGGSMTTDTIVVRLTDGTLSGLGEAAPTKRYSQPTEVSLAFLKGVDGSKLSFNDIPGSMAYLDTLSTHNPAAKAAINVALLDGAARKAGKAIYDFLGLGFKEGPHVTSYSIGIDTPAMIAKKVLEAEIYSVLKLKVGAPGDRENFAALRSAAPTKTVRIDGNEGWKTKEEALRNLEWFAQDKNVEYVEQPMPDGTPVKDMAWLKERSPMPIYGDESYHTAKDINLCAECFHGVNVKLVKTSGITGAYEALQAARKAGLKTMIGCMIESSILITAAAHLSELADHLDIDGNILIANDPFIGATADRGIISFAKTPEKLGLRVCPR